ncbi:MAG TPA: hypothetical protein VF746_21705 [Longimicrobium sp.]|jgi:hypothetical protein
MRARRLLPITIALFSLAAACTGSRALAGQDERAVRREIEAEIANTLDIAKRRDYQAFAARMPADFTVHMLNGTVVGRDSVLSRARLRWERGIDTGGLEIALDSLRVDGARATVYTTQRFTRLAPGTDGVQRRVTTGVVHRETWERRGGRWIAVRQEELAQAPTLVDGQPYRPDSSPR